jgi:branched-chain amino acid aminotransferase
MLSVRWTATTGWEAPRIHPLEELRLHPATSSLHYGFQCFEGTKVYKDAAGRLRLFRPDMNMRRLNVSAERLSLPTFDAESAVQLLARFASYEERFVPQ